jgi:motility quorum-sensing regulator / GCU-specific mRNA interferase toxin
VDGDIVDNPLYTSNNLLAKFNQRGESPDREVGDGKKHTALQAAGGQNLGRVWSRRSTFSALAGAAALGLDFDGIVAVVSALTAADFYKSMTTYTDHRIWQDVYRPTTPVGDVYLKLTVIDDVLVVSFKEI